MIHRIKTPLLGIAILLSLLASCTINSAQSTLSGFNRQILFNDGWKFLRDSISGPEHSEFDDSDWMKIDLPHDYSIMDLPGEDNADQIGPFSKKAPGNGNSTGHTLGGSAWYRKSFKLSPADKAKSVILMFDGIYMESEVWVNGIKAGENKNGYTPFWMDISPMLNAAGKSNTIAVRVSNEGRNSRWYSGSGIYRNVHLLVLNPVHLSVWGVRITSPDVNESMASLDLELSITNELDKEIPANIMLEIKDDRGIRKANMEYPMMLGARSETTSSRRVSIENPSLWTPETPHLYFAEITVKTSGGISDIYHQKFGIRSIEISAEKGFVLNGIPRLLKGACLHHDNGLLGAAAFDRAEIRKVQLMKANGYNAIRTAHNPPSTAFLDACDSIGIMVIEEFSDMWETYKNPQDYSRFFKEHWEKDLTDMTLRDRNHPSIVMWSIGNEVLKSSVEEGLRIGREMVHLQKTLDPSRMVTEAITSVFTPGGWEETGPIFELLDAAGYNYKLARYEADHEEYPQRVMYGSESFPIDAYDYWNAVLKYPFVIGDFVWTGMDYLGEVSIANSTYVPEAQKVKFQLPENLNFPPGFNIFDYVQRMPSNWPNYNAWCGDLDLLGFKKPQSLYRDILWDNSPIEINVHEYIPEGMAENISGWGWPKEWPQWYWPGDEGKLLEVRVFSKASVIKLFLNDQQVGEKILTGEDKYIASFLLPYQKGTLKAVALKEGHELAQKSLTTPGKPTAIRLEADRYEIRADRNDLAFIPIHIIDEFGQTVPIDSVMLNLKIEGNAELSGSGNASPGDMASFNKPMIRSYKGRALAILRPTAVAGVISLSVSADGLKSDELKIHVR